MYHSYGFLLLVLSALVPGADEPPRNLTAEQQQEVDRLAAQASNLLATARFEEAVKVGKQVVAYREERQGKNHWEVIDARFEVEDWLRWTMVPEKDRQEVLRALKTAIQGQHLQSRHQYREAEAKLREALGDFQSLLGDEHPHTATVYNDVALCLNAQGKYAEALPLFQKAMGIRQKVLGEEHPDTASSYNRVASCLESQGKHAQSLMLYQKALDIFRKVLGEEHPITAATYNNLAGCLQSQGKYAEALPLHHKALGMRQKVLGEEHSETAQSYNNVAFCLQSQGRYHEALPLFEKSLGVYRQVLGEGHLTTASVYNNLASCLHSQGKLQEALPLFQKALGINQKVLGEEHPDTALSYNNVAGCLNDQGKHQEALPLYQKALRIKQKVLGEEDPSTATSYNNVASCLNDQGKHAEALPLYQNALGIRQRVLGERHPLTATTYNNVAGCLASQGRVTQALPLFLKALGIRQQVLGEEHPHTAQSYNNVAGCLASQGKYTEALPLLQKVLAIRQKLLGEYHPSTAASYSGVALCLNSQGKHAQALPLHQKALKIVRQVLGEDHPGTAGSYSGVAVCLDSQGKHAEALPLFQKALGIFQKVLGEEHPSTATSSNSAALCLHRQGRYAEALPLFQKALATRQKVLGEEHPQTAESYNNVALCLYYQGVYAEALPLYQKALEINRKVLGEEHRGTALTCNNAAVCLKIQGKYAEALTLYQKALGINRKVLGEQHPDTAHSYNNMAHCLYSQGRYDQAADNWEKALLGYDFGQLNASATGFERALFHADVYSPRVALACSLVRLDQPVKAWEHAESDIGRGLLDDLLASQQDTPDQDEHARLRFLDQALLPLHSQETLDEEQLATHKALAQERIALLNVLAQNAVRRARGRVHPLERIQKQIRDDTAVVFWLDVQDEHLGCVLRHEGEPRWVRLPGTGKNGDWIEEDGSLANRILQALSDARSDFALRKKLLEDFHRQRIAPLVPHLAGVEHLLVIPAGTMSAFPVEALTDEYTISYIPSASVYAKQAEEHRTLQASSLLVLADPVFTPTEPKFPPAPEAGLLIKAILPGGIASRIRLHAGDVLLEYNSKQLTKPGDLEPPQGVERVPIKLWRAGNTLAGRIPGGKLGVVVDARPVAEALADWHKQNELTFARSEPWQALPGTRLEARTLAGLIPTTTALLGSEASEQNLQELVSSGKLKKYRLLHLATHGETNWERPELSALILSQDNLPTPEEQARLILEGKQPPEGKLTVQIILSDWDLDADLVVLSACQTGLGKPIYGEGMLGFTQALLQKGARSVVLSRWKVDDAATSLLMARFYKNLLGQREGLSEPMKRAEALGEAKDWLRRLTREEAETRLAALLDGVPRGERGSIQAPLPVRKPDAPEKGERLFTHPYYWAAFVLIGDPN